MELYFVCALFHHGLVGVDPLALPIRVSNATITLTLSFSNLANARDTGWMLVNGGKRCVPKEYRCIKKGRRGKARGHSGQ